MKHTFPISDLPFHVHSFEESCGKVRSAEEVCPGIYSIWTEPIPPNRFLGSNLIVVMADSPAVSPAAKAYGTPLEAAPEVLVYCDEDGGSSSMKSTSIVRSIISPRWMMALWWRTGCGGWRSARSISESSRSRLKPRGGLRSGMTVWRMASSG